jgi:epoxide hydrolase 4
MALEMQEPFAKIERGYAQVGGVKLHYAQCGTGGKLVLLLHGFPQFWYSWRYQLVALGSQYTVVAPDMRGFNLSDKPERISEYEIQHLVDDATGLIRHFGAKQAAVIGHDWGAGVAWATAMSHPEYVWKLGALQVPPMCVWRRNMTIGQALRSWYMLFFQIPRLPEYWISADDFAALKRTLRDTTLRPGVFDEFDIKQYVDAISRPGALTASINYYRANLRSMIFGRNDSGRSERVDVPTIFIYGERDFAIAPSTVEGVDTIVDAPYTELRFPHSNHWVQEELPVDVNEALLKFLAA